MQSKPQRILTHSPTHTKQTEKHVQRQQKGTFITPLTLSCWRWARAPLCAVWSCSALNSSPATHPEITRFHWLPLNTKPDTNYAPRPWWPSSEEASRLLESLQNKAWCRGPGSDLTLTTAIENTALLREKVRESLPHFLSSLSLLLTLLI